MNEIIAIEGDYVKSKKSSLFFDVKGVQHPKDRTICFVRFVPSLDGDRIINGVNYKKIYDLQERYTFLKNKYPEYLFYSKQFDMELQGIKNEEIEEIFSPRSYYRKLQSEKLTTSNELRALNLCELFIEKGEIPKDSIGITGSQMVGLNKEDSDIDLVIYGTQVGINFQEKIEELFLTSKFCREYTFDEFKLHYKLRAKGSKIAFDDFLKYEKRKLHQGKFHGIDFFIRYIKNPEDWEESYYECQYKNYGRIKLKARIIDAKDSIFTPCNYKIEVIDIQEKNKWLKKINTIDIKEIKSFRGRFCEQAKEGELIYAEGKIEKVLIKNKQIYYRVIIGNTKTDKMLLL